MTSTKAPRTKGKEMEKLKCLCFVRHHNRTQSVPWIIHRQHKSFCNNCGKTSLFIDDSMKVHIPGTANDVNVLLINSPACTKWGTELTRKSYNHLSQLCKDKDDDLTKSMMTFECEAVENQLTKSATPDLLREWWGFFLDPSEVEADLLEVK
jgi:hypothetical protein